MMFSLLQAYLDYVVFLNEVAKHSMEEMRASGSAVMEEEHIQAAIIVRLP